MKPVAQQLIDTLQRRAYRTGLPFVERKDGVRKTDLLAVAKQALAVAAVRALLVEVLGPARAHERDLSALVLDTLGDVEKLDAIEAAQLVVGHVTYSPEDAKLLGRASAFKVVHPHGREWYGSSLRDALEQAVRGIQEGDTRPLGWVGGAREG
jgi:hypothetical protein